MTESQHTVHQIPTLQIESAQYKMQFQEYRVLNTRCNFKNKECSIQDIIVEHLIQVSLMIACCMKLKVATYSIEKLY